jgi:hypothetical protein
MQGAKLSTVFAKEGFSLPRTYCDSLLETFHRIEPSIQGVFQEYIKKEITDKRKLTNLFGRSRDFFGYCPWRDNSKVFRDAYSYIPQGSIGDNTGAALLYCEQKGLGLVVSETHDALLLEINDTFEDVLFGVRLLQRAFRRILRCQNGFEFEIPVEMDICYNLRDTKGLPDFSEESIQLTLEKLYETRRNKLVTSVA